MNTLAEVTGSGVRIRLLITENGESLIVERFSIRRQTTRVERFARRNAGMALGQYNSHAADYAGEPAITVTLPVR